MDLGSPFSEFVGVHTSDCEGRTFVSGRFEWMSHGRSPHLVSFLPGGIPVFKAIIKRSQKNRARMPIPYFKLDRRLIFERYGLGQECGCGGSIFVSDGSVRKLWQSSPPMVLSR